MLISTFLWAYFIKAPSIKLKIESRIQSKDEFVLSLVNYVYSSIDTVVNMYLLVAFSLIVLVFSQLYGIIFVYRLGIKHANTHNLNANEILKSAQQTDASETMT